MSIRISILFFILFSCNKENKTPQLITPKSAIDSYHGTDIKDSYRNLENLKDSTVVNWFKDQGEFAFETLEKIPGRQSLINQFMSYEQKTNIRYKFIRFTANGRYFYTRNDENGKTFNLYFKNNLSEEEIYLLNPTDYFEDKDYRISYVKPDWKGTKVAIGLSKRGEEISNIIVVDVATRTVLPGVIKNSVTNLGGINWLSDNSGFTYLYSPVTDPTNSKYWMDMKSIVYKLGSNPNTLIDVFSKENNPELKLKSEDFPIVYNYDENDGYVFAVVGGSASSYDVYYKKEIELLNSQVKWKPLFKKSDHIKRIRVDKKDNLIFLSSKGASNFKICKTKMSALDFDNPEEVLVSEKKNKIITNFVLAQDGVYFTTVKNGVDSKLYHVKDSIETEVILPRDVNIINPQSRSNNQDFLRISTGGAITPSTHYIYDINTKKIRIESIIPKGEYPGFENLIMENIEIASHDGVMVPVTIIRDKNSVKNGNNPTLFIGYGAYGNRRSTPFNPILLTWVIEGGIIVYPHVRGGGQKGEAWHKAGYKTTKPNTWKDMISATEYMIKEKYTNLNKTVIWGSSAGGICAGRAMTDRPDLYKAVLLTSPALNMLRSEIQPNGQNSIKEFGTVAIKEEFEALLEMDSYHHIEKGVEYPATFVTGGFKDGRVVIWDPAKFVAKLQAYNGSDNPVLFGVKFDQGHGNSGADKLGRYEFYANGFAFALWQMGYEEYQPKHN